MKNLRYFSFIILAIAFQSLAGIFGKYAALTLPAPSLIGIVTNVFYILSLGCLFLQAIVWQQALRHYDISLAYPFQSLTIFVILIYSYIFFYESISGFNILGICIILSGIILLNQEMHGGAEE